MTVVWDDSYLTGHKEIDDDHRTILLFINGIESEIKKGAKENTLRQDIDALIIEIEEHFKREEHVLRELSAPLSSIEKIQEEHQTLWREGRLLLETLHSASLGKNQIDSCLEVLGRFEKWFIFRITVEDMIIKEILSKKRVGI